jgi:hypothetical protein
LRLIRRLAIPLSLLVCLVPVHAIQQEGGVAAIKTADGFLLVWNKPDVHFTLAIKGKDVRPLNSTERVFFNVDGIVVQVQSVAISEFMKDATKQKPDDRSVLMAHRDWESQFLQSSLLGKKINVQTVPQKLDDGKEALLWKFDMPEMPEGVHTTAKEQVYLTMVSGHHVILLNAAVEGNTAESLVQRFLMNTIATLRVSSKPIDAQELQKSIRAGNPR